MIRSTTQARLLYVRVEPESPRRVIKQKPKSPSPDSTW